MKIVSNIFLGFKRLRVAIKRVASPLHTGSLHISLRNIKSSTNWVKLAEDAGIAALAGAASPIAVTLVSIWIIFYVSANEGDPWTIAKFAFGACVLTIGLAFKLRPDHLLIGRQLLTIGIASFIITVGFATLAFALPGFRSMLPGESSFESLLLLNKGAVFLAVLGPGLAAPMFVRVGRNMVRAFKTTE